MCEKRFTIKNSEFSEGKYSISDNEHQFLFPNCDYKVVLFVYAEAFNQLNDELKQQLNSSDGSGKKLNDCENCHHLNTMIDYDGIFYQCLKRNKLWEKCNDFDDAYG